MKLFNYSQSIGILVCCCLLACQENENAKSKTIIYGEFIAEGNIKISKDTSFEGLIKFYDRATRKLQYEENYKNGVAHGLSKAYYPNGKIEAELNFNDGKELGFVNHYDNSGRLLSRNYMYYGVRMGPGIDYKNDSLKEYHFYSFDNDLLFSLNYDSIYGHKITELQKGFIFYLTYDVLHENENAKSYLLYLINPPKYKFEYSLVLVDENFNLKKVVEQYSPELVFAKFRIEPNNKDFRYALQLKVYDSVNDLTGIMFKVLN